MVKDSTTKQPLLFNHTMGCLFICILSFSMISCGLIAPLPVCDNMRNCYAVEVAYGPEDFVFDKWQPLPRLLIASLDRRDTEKSGEIYYFDLKTGYSSPLQRTGEPETDFFFRPLGMDIQRYQGKTYLYVILKNLHGNTKNKENGIAIYRVLEKELKFDRLLENTRYLWSPNDLSVLETGEVYVTNDYHSDMEIIFGKKSSEVVYFSPRGDQWSVVADGLSVANGILAQSDRVFITASRSNKLLVYRRNADGSLDSGRTVAEIKGPDNIMPFKNKLLVAAHFNDIAFMRHRADKNVPSPSVIFLVDPDNDTGEDVLTPVYVNDGNQISAASTAFIYKNKLYISQIFGKKIAVCDAADLNWENE